MKIIWIVVFCVMIVGVTCQELGPELLHNPGFEDPNFQWWTCNACVMTSETTDVFEGQRSVRVSNRNSDSGALGQEVELNIGGRYYFAAHVKLLNDIPAQFFQRMQLTLRLTFTDATKQWLAMAKTPMLRSQVGWQKLGADFMVPVDKEVESFRIYFSGTPQAINYLVDACSLREISERTGWRAEADANIDQHRKNNVNMRLNIQGHDPADVTVEVDQTSHAFPFGTAVNRRPLLEPSAQQYRDFLFENFNYAVIENSLKWRLMEPVQGQPDFERPLAVIDVLASNNMPIRGHCIFWGLEKNLPDWLINLPVPQIQQHTERRLNETVTVMRGKLTHWDVNNENLHGQFFEEKFQDSNFTHWMFSETAKLDPDVKLFLNDFEIVNRGALTEALLKQALQVKEANVGLYGIGAQSHIKDDTAPDPTLIWRRLDTIAQAGVPIWITEASVATPDENLRADWYETILRLYFGHPDVEGMLIWGFWDQQIFNVNCALATGQDFRVNAAGQRWIQVVWNEWTTHESHLLSDGTSFSFRGFHGDYDVKVKVQSAVVHQQTFSLGKQDINVDVNVP